LVNGENGDTQLQQVESRFWNTTVRSEGSVAGRSGEGASAQLDGTYNVITEKIDLHGMLRTNAELANTTHGPKALFLKVLDRFFKKKHAGYIAPVKITGTYSHPSFGLDLNRNHHQHASGG